MDLLLLGSFVSHCLADLVSEEELQNVAGSYEKLTAA